MIKVDVTKRLSFPDGTGSLTVNYDFEENTVTAVYGPSGAGKTSLLRMLAGLTNPDEGKIEVNGATWFNASKKVNLPPQKRDAGFVFQDYALFPNMSVLQNLTYAAGNNIDRKFIEDLLITCHLAGLEHQKPGQLSGGQKQRTALARALMRKPSLLLLDEPLSATDNATRGILQDLVLELQSQYKFTALLVTHDIGEIYKLAKHAVHLENGTVIKSGNLTQVFGGDTQNYLSINGAVIQLDNGFALVRADDRNLKVTDPGTLNIGDKVNVSMNALQATVTKL